MKRATGKVAIESSRSRGRLPAERGSRADSPIAFPPIGVAMGSSTVLRGAGALALLAAALAFTAGLADSQSYLSRHLFGANMTGNTRSRSSARCC